MTSHQQQKSHKQPISPRQTFTIAPLQITARPFRNTRFLRGIKVGVIGPRSSHPLFRRTCRCSLVYMRTHTICTSFHEGEAERKLRPGIPEREPPTPPIGAVSLRCAQMVYLRDARDVRARVCSRVRVWVRSCDFPLQRLFT